jgi:ketosteroid isomerase-like protein
MTLTVLLLALSLATATAAEHDAAEAEVRAAVIAFNDAYAGNDAATYFSYYEPDAMVYFYGARQDVAAYREEWTAMIAEGGGVEKNDLSDLQVRIVPGGDMAIASYFVDYAMRTPAGEISTAQGFESEVWQKVAGEWKIVGLHYSEIPAGD